MPKPMSCRKKSCCNEKPTRCNLRAAPTLSTWSKPARSQQQINRQIPQSSPGQKTGVGSPPLLQGIFPTQGLNPGLPQCGQILYQLSHKGSPKILEWVSLSLLQRIFPTQASNRGLLHCRQILYQLRYQGSPVFRKLNVNSRNPFGHDRICAIFSAGRQGRLEGRMLPERLRQRDFT